MQSFKREMLQSWQTGNAHCRAEKMAILKANVAAGSIRKRRQPPLAEATETPRSKGATVHQKPCCGWSPTVMQA
jgi:hypothetical protein